MKRWMMFVTAILFCMGLGMTADADEMEGQPYFTSVYWKLQDVDVSGVQEVDGRLVGAVKLPEKDGRGLPTGELRVDCALPSPLSEEQQAKLQVTYQTITEKDLLEAMNEVGQDAGRGRLEAYALSPEAGASYEREGEISNGYFCDLLCDVSYSMDAAFTAEYAQAKDVTRSLVEALGGKLCERVLHANRRDAVHSIDYLRMGMLSRPEGHSAEYMKQYEERETKAGRPERNLTMVSGLYELYDLPVMPEYCYPSGGDWCGASSHVLSAVRDDGALCSFSVSCMPQVIGVEPLAPVEATWQALLQRIVAYMVRDGMSSEDIQLEDCTEYARYGIITELQPCWTGKTKDTLEPGWYCVIEEHLVKDDSLVAINSGYGDTETLLGLER